MREVELSVVYGSSVEKKTLEMRVDALEVRTRPKLLLSQRNGGVSGLKLGSLNERIFPQLTQSTGRLQQNYET